MDALKNLVEALKVTRLSAITRKPHPHPSTVKLTAKKVNMQNIETNKDIAISVVAFVASGIQLIRLNWVDQMQHLHWPNF